MWKLTLLPLILFTLACSAGGSGDDVNAAKVPPAPDLSEGEADVAASPEVESSDVESFDELDQFEGYGSPHPIGMQVPPFLLEDLNPTSPTFGKFVDSADLAGQPYALIFLDSRCPECGTVADGLWEAYQQHPGWWEAQPLFAVQRAAALEKAPQTVEGVVDGNDVPYLADTEETNLWMAFMALNHDFFAIDANGKIAAWLELYSWPEALAIFTDHMTQFYGE